MQGTRTKTKTAGKARHARAGLVITRKTPLPPKLTSPRADRLYPRRRLFKRLDHLRKDHRIIWISAPGGAGKTSLAASYLVHHKLPDLWYEVDAGDADLASFFYYMGLAVKHAAPRHRKPLPALTPEYLGDVPTFSRNFFRELFRRLPQRTVLVLDNYQEVPETSVLHEVLNLAMVEVPDGMNLLVLSRIEPPAVLARLQLSGHAACLGGDEMRLTREETTALGTLRFGKAADRRTLQAVHDRAHGWAAGAVLMLEQEGNGKPTDRLLQNQERLFGYFAGEVLNRTTPVTRDFLLKTALLPDIGTAAAAELTGNGKARAILDDLARRNFFTLRRAGPNGDSYQYHPLFREFLLATLAHHYSPDLLNGLRRKAAHVLTGTGQFEAAAELLRESRDHPRLAALVMEQAPALLAQGRYELLTAWLSALPPDLFDTRPWLSCWLGLCRLPFDPLEARGHFERTYRLFRHAGDASGAYLSWAGIADSFVLLWDDFTGLHPWLDELQALERDHPQFPATAIAARVAASVFAALTYARPHGPEMERWRQRAEALLESEPDPNFRMQLIGSLGLYCFSMGRHADQQRLGRLAGSLDRHESITPLSRINARLFQSLHTLAQGDAEAAEDLAQQALEIAERSGVHVLDMFVLAQGVYARAQRGDLDGMGTYLERIRERLSPARRLDVSHYHYQLGAHLSLRGERTRGLEHLRRGLALAEQAGAEIPVAYCRVALAQTLTLVDALDEAQSILDRVEEQALRMGSRQLRYLGGMVRAGILLRRGQESACAEELRTTLALGAENEYLAYSLWHQDMLAPVLAFALRETIEPEYVRRMIRAVPLAPPATADDRWPFPLKLRALGRFSLHLHGKPLPPSPAHKKPLQLLHALVALGGRGVNEQPLAETLWPEAEGDTAHQALKVNVHRLRKLLPAGTLDWSDRQLSLDATKAWVDTWVLERELNTLERAAADAALQAGIARRVLELYRGEFLAGNSMPWAVTARERLRDKTLRVVTRAAEFIGRHDPAAAVAIFEKAIEIDSLRESLYAGLMRCHLALRQRAEGLRVYRRCRDVLQRELDLAPSPAVESLHRALKTGLS